MARHLPPLNALRFFEVAARHRSFVRAAEELHVTPAAVSQQIKLLEDHLGVTLFKRGKTLVVNEAATDALNLVSDAFDQLERAMLRVRSGSIAGPLTVSAPPVFAARWLVPRLGDFYARYPDVEIHLLATKRVVDFSMEEVDMAIRFGSDMHPGLSVERLMPEMIVPVAAPRLARSVKKPSDLACAKLIEDDWHVMRGVFPEWETLLASLGVAGAPLNIRRFGDTDLALQAAVTGLGVTLAWHSLVADDIRSRKLVQILDHSIPTDLSFQLVMPKNKIMLNKVAAFRSWLFEQAGLQGKTEE
ncbi:transcriptional regulator GcvA [Sideroxydans sp. CL21]|uniref:transcriptional regulator GcvA n=1 Tax=Sideroxydans sp. CL21 TaxID=2600596 RepID=UPI0012A8E3D8|nr:transcriptional regulator GcvA [Sideroxydans sp. CL21]VVC85014.1 Transcriptional regulator, LysR family [Sideroxydans sp. CL21]